LSATSNNPVRTPPHNPGTAATEMPSDPLDKHKSIVMFYQEFTSSGHNLSSTLLMAALRPNCDETLV
jgi:hypothetical protein